MIELRKYERMHVHMYMYMYMYITCIHVVSARIYTALVRAGGGGGVLTR